MRILRVIGSIACVSLAALASAQEPRTTPATKTDAAPSDAPLLTLKSPTELIALAVSHDGNRVAISSRSDVRFFDSATGKEKRFLNSHGGDAVAFSRDLKRIALVRSYTVVLHDAVRDKEIVSIDPKFRYDPGFPFRPKIMAVAFSPDARQLATAGGEARDRRTSTLLAGVVKVWDVETGKEIQRLGELPLRSDSVAFSPDGKYLTAGTQGEPGEVPKPGEVRVWDATTFDLLHTFKTKPAIVPGEDPCSVVDVAFNPKGTRLAAAVSDGTVHVWELPSGREILNQRGHHGEPGPQEVDVTGLVLGRQRAVRSVAFHPDGTRLALAGYDRVIRVWDSDTGKETNTFRFDVPRINAVAFSSDGRRLAAAGGDSTNSGTAIIWQLSKE